MLIAIEGVSAAGKTTRSSRYAPAVIEEIAGPPPVTGIEQVGEYWSDRNAERWRRGLALEGVHATACFDTDPLKIHYAWCLWQVGAGERDQWLATVRATRRRLIKREIGFVDRVVFLEPAESVVRRQKESDGTRRRGNFELHVRLHEPLRRWYGLLEDLAPGRVIFNGHESSDVPAPEARRDRYSVELFDEFMNAANRRAG